MPKKTVSREKDVNYTVAGLLALVGIVVFTALFFAQEGRIPALASSNENIAGQAYGIEPVDADAPTDCAISSWCDGSKLVRQREDCKQYYAYCQYGCSVQVDQAVCL